MINAIVFDHLQRRIGALSRDNMRTKYKNYIFTGWKLVASYLNTRTFLDNVSGDNNKERLSWDTVNDILHGPISGNFTSICGLLKVSSAKVIVFLQAFLFRTQEKRRTAANH